MATSRRYWSYASVVTNDEGLSLLIPEACRSNGHSLPSQFATLATLPPTLSSPPHLSFRTTWRIRTHSPKKWGGKARRFVFGEIIIYFSLVYIILLLVFPDRTKKWLFTCKNDGFSLVFGMFFIRFQYVFRCKFNAFSYVFHLYFRLYRVLFRLLSMCFLSLLCIHSFLISSLIALSTYLY